MAKSVPSVYRQLRQALPARQDGTSNQGWVFTLPETILSGEYTFGVWARKNASGNFEDLFTVETTSFEWTFQTKSGGDPFDMGFWANGAHASSSNTPIAVGEWYYFLVEISYTNDVQGWSAYDIQGNLVAEEFATYGSSPNGTVFTIGDWEGAAVEPWTGNFQNLKIWYRLLTDATSGDSDKRQEIVRKEAFNFEPQDREGLIGWYPLDSQWRNFSPDPFPPLVPASGGPTVYEQTPAPVYENVYVPVYQPSGDGGTEFTQNVGGSMAPSGALARQINLTRGGTMTMTGALSRLIQLTKSGTITPSGQVTKQIPKGFSGSMAPSGSIVKQTNLTPAGSMAMSGSLGKFVQLVRGGSIAISGSITRAVTKTFTGSMALSGALKKLMTLTVAGSTALSGAVSTTFVSLQTVTGSMAPSGSISKLISKVVSANLAPSGGINRQTSKTFTGSMAPSGSISRQTSKIFSGQITLAGAMSTGAEIAQGVAGSIVNLAGALTATPVAPPSISAVISQVRGWYGRKFGNR